MFSLLAGYLLGKVFQRLVIQRLRKAARRTTWELDDIAIEAVRNMPVLWFALGGLWAGLEWLSLGPQQKTLTGNLLFIAVTWSVTVVASRFGAGYATRQASRVRGVMPSTTIFSNIARAMIYIVGALVTMQTLGISITPIRLLGSAVSRSRSRCRIR